MPKKASAKRPKAKKRTKKAPVKHAAGISKKHASKIMKTPSKPPGRKQHPRAAKPISRVESRDFLASLKREIAEGFATASEIKAADIIGLIETPPGGIGADFAIPCFSLAKQFRKAPQQIAQDIAGRIPPVGMIKDVKQSGPYVNFLIDWKKASQEVIPHILQNPDYGSSDLGKGKTVLIDFSSPNTAKPMSVGHLRSTVIGDSLSRMHRMLGYKVIGDNHLGDWGTQFGKIIVAYRRWGHAERLEKNPIEELLRVYVKFHEDLEISPGLEDEARLAFKSLEDGDKESLELWKRFSDLSRREFDRTYSSLGVSFDFQLGESFYNKMAKEVIEEALKKGVAKWSEHALVIDTGHDIPLIIRKSDEATLYATRDLATIKYRLAKFHPDRILYVVGSEQKSYLQQLFVAAEKLGYVTAGEGKLVQVSFGMLSLPEGKMSTRSGRVVFLDHVIDEVTKLAEKTIEAKNPELKNRESVAKQVGIGAIKYADLSRDRIKDIRFDWNEMLSFEGDTGPYIQYTHARACSILRKGNVKSPPKKVDATLLTDPKEKALVRKLMEFPETVRKASEDYRPSHIANYVFALATSFNEFYQDVPVLKSEGGLRNARLALVFATKEVLKKGLYLLGIDAPEEM